MERISYFLTIFLDVFPYIFLQFMPFKNKLRYGYAKTILISLCVLMLWFLPFTFMADKAFFTESIMSTWRFSLLLGLLVLGIFLVKENFLQHIFIFGLILPYVLTVLTFASFLGTHINSWGISEYYVSIICRVGIVAITFPGILSLFFHKLIPIMELQDGGIWKYAWPIPLCYNFISFFFINPSVQIKGATYKAVLGHLTIMISCILICILISKVLKYTQERSILLEKEKRNQFLLALQTQQYEAISKNIEETMRSRHDLRHQILLIQSLANGEKIKELQKYLKEYTNTLPLEAPITEFCKSYAINSVLNHYIIIAKKNNIKIETDLKLSDISNISESDLCLVFGNLIENAIEGCNTVMGKRCITIKSEILAGRFSIIIKNNYDGIFQTNNELYFSRKRSFQREGVGITTVKAVVEKYGGKIRIEQQSDKFIVSLYLQIFAL